MSAQKNSNKRFNREAASFILGESPTIRLAGSPKKIKAARHVLLASRNLYEELNKEAPSLQEVSRLFREKHDRAQTFKEVVGISWHL